MAGVDEAGRGALAGPLWAAAVVLPPRPPRALAEGLDDSKRLSPARREEMAEAVRACALAFGIGRASAREVERLNPLGASMRAMERALEALRPPARAALVDGPRAPPRAPCPCLPLVGGDGLSLSAAAASVLAKTGRDREMERLGRALPGWGLERHRGYGTAAHLEALARLGPSREHRRTFAPVRASSRARGAAPDAT